MVEAIPELLSEKSVRVFEKFGVFTRSELESRVEIKYENYAKTVNIEAKTMIDMATKADYTGGDPLQHQAWLTPLSKSARRESRK